MRNKKMLVLLTVVPALYLAYFFTVREMVAPRHIKSKAEVAEMLVRGCIDEDDNIDTPLNLASCMLFSIQLAGDLRLSKDLVVDASIKEISKKNAERREVFVSGLDILLGFLSDNIIPNEKLERIKSAAGELEILDGEREAGSLPPGPDNWPTAAVREQEFVRDMARSEEIILARHNVKEKEVYLFRSIQKDFPGEASRAWAAHVVLKTLDGLK